jgi:glycosyltransferase involved in cell wall biosynthesis
MGEAGRKRVVERFTQTAMAEKHIELYERIRKTPK